ncbi:MAG TPA: ATP-binding protein [Candidatus Gemmiger faecavium]|nr:ATP-binding protein [Candidatus Gemmiger faecavium]
MIKLIVGPKGAGKTKTMIDMIDNATKTTAGNIVVIEKSMKLTTSINHQARLLDVDEYGIQGGDMLYGFVAGVLAGNYDITELFIDGILRIVDHDMDVAATVLDKIDAITRDSVEVVITVSATEDALPEGIKKYMNA